MAKDYPGGIVLNPAQPDEASALVDGVSPRNHELLGVGVKRRFGVLPENTLFTPVPIKGRRARVDVVSRLVRLPSAQNYSHDVEWTGSIVPVLHLRSDLVVWLSNCIDRTDA